MVRNVLISIQGMEYTTDLIILLGLSINVILGMNWMKHHGVLIDTSTQTVVAEPPKKSGPRAPIDVSTDLR